MDRSNQRLFFLAFFLWCLPLVGCVTSEDEARSALRKHGFTNISVDGWALWGCGEQDKVGQRFTAKNAQGEPVDGTVCCGVLKGCTIRF